MYFRRRLRAFILIGVISLFFVFLITLSQFDDVERTNDEYKARLLKEKLAREANRRNGGGGGGGGEDVHAPNDNRKNNLKDKVAAKFSNRYRFNSNNNNNDDALVDDANRIEDDDYSSSYLLNNEQHLERTFKVVSRMDRLVHLDLKGAAPKLNYLKDFIPYAQKSGATGLLIEYDDFFPYKAELENVKNQNHYTNQELQAIFSLAKKSNLIVVPYVQTLNDLEFILKLKQFAHLRDSKSSHFSLINPCLNETYEKLLFKLLDQVIDLHPEEDQQLGYIHIGVSSRIKSVDLTKPECKTHPNLLNSHEDLLINHLNLVSNYVRKKRPNLKVLIWDDALRDLKINDSSRLKRLNNMKVVPMVSNFNEFVDVDLNTLKTYAKYFDEFWLASAFKGSTSELEIMPNAKNHYRNQLSWLNLASRLSDPSKLKGIALLGRSRYDHMQSVCELLPASVPSLVLSLQTIVNYDQTETEIFKDVKQLTQCDYDRTLTGFLLDTSILLRHHELSSSKILSSSSSSNSEKLYKCNFPGADLYSWLLELKLTIQYFELHDQRFGNILNSFNMKYKFFNTMAFDEAVNVFYPTVRSKLRALVASGEKEFDKYFYADLYEELTNVYILRRVDLIDKRLVELNKTVKPEFAPVRPFNKIEQTII